MLNNKKAKIALEVLVVLIVVVLASGTTLALVKAGVLQPKEGAGEVSVLNAEFIPMGRAGYLAIKKFQFCGFVDENYNCVDEQEEFNLGSDVYFRFVVESTTYQGEVKLVENYRIKGPDGGVLLEVENKDNYHFEVKSRKNKELVYFSDYFTVGEDLPEGEYTLELLMVNPLLDKRVTLTERFKMGR